MRRHCYLAKALIAGWMLMSVLACVTQREVRAVVAESNATMIDAPSLPQLEDGLTEGQKEALKTAIARMDRLIEHNPNEKVLVNLIRVRQAMLLTVYREFGAAKEAWGKVDSKVGLPTGRDRALYELRDHFHWWFKKSVDSTFSIEVDRPQAGKAMKDFATQLESLPKQSDIAFYLETMRAMIVVKRANHTNISGGDRLNVASMMVEALKRLAGRFDAEDHEWVKANIDKDQKAVDQPLSRLRARVWLRAAVRTYRQVADNKGLNPTWDPEWIGTVAVDLGGNSD